MKRVTIIALSLLAALVFASCGNNNNGGGGSGASAPGVTKTTVKIGSHQPLTGSAAPGYSEIAPASAAFFKYINAQGGVNGRKIQYIYKDDGYNPTRTVSVVRSLVLQDKVFAIFDGLGTPTHTKVTDFLNTSKVPDLFVASGCRCWDDPGKHPETFGWQPDYVVEGKILGQYIKQNFAGKKVAYFFQNDDFGKDGVAGLDQMIPKGDVVARENYQPGNTDVAPQISAIQKSGAQVVVNFTIPAYTALAELTSLKIGFKPQFVVSNVGSDPTTLGGLLKSFSKGKADTQLIEGMISDSYLPATDDLANPWTKLFRGIQQQYNGKRPFTGNTMYGMAVAYTFVQALKAAGANPTRESIVKAVENGGFRGPGVVPFRYSGSSHAGYTGVGLWQFKGGKTSPIGKAQTTDSGTGAITEFTEQQPSPDAGGIIKK